jgi:ribonuclease HII
VCALRAIEYATLPRLSYRARDVAHACARSHLACSCAVAALCRTPGVEWACGAVGHAEVDRLGAHGAATEAMRLAAARLDRRLRRGAVLAAAGRTFHLVDGDSSHVPEGLVGAAVVRGDREEAAIAAASIIAWNAHEATMRGLARRWPLWGLDVNLGWPSAQHVRSLAAVGPSGCHRAACFPLQRRQGRRMAYHPQRAAYQRIQYELARATTALQIEGNRQAPSEPSGFGADMDGRNSGACGEQDSSESSEAALRERRYRDFVAARHAHDVVRATGVPNGGAPASRTGVRKTKRKASKRGPRGRAASDLFRPDSLGGGFTEGTRW